MKIEFTEDEIKSFRKFEDDVRKFMFDRSNGALNTPPIQKPCNYDLWKFGPMLMEIEAVPVIPCRGGELVDNSWRWFNER